MYTTSHNIPSSEIIAPAEMQRKQMLEDLLLKHLKPEAYYEIKRHVGQRRSYRKNRLKAVIDTVRALPRRALLHTAHTKERRNAMESYNREFGISPDNRWEILESVLEAIDVPFLATGPHLRLLFFSRRGAEIFGLSLADVGRPVEELFPGGPDSEAFRAVEHTMKHGERARAQVELPPGGVRYHQRTQALEAPHWELGGIVLTYEPEPSPDNGP